MREYINPVVSTLSVLKLNKFGSKYKTYANALKNNTPTSPYQTKNSKQNEQQTNTPPKQK